jgi:hypothetical protein
MPLKHFQLFLMLLHIGDEATASTAAAAAASASAAAA